MENGSSSPPSKFLCEHPGAIPLSTWTQQAWAAERLVGRWNLKNVSTGTKYPVTHHSDFSSRNGNVFPHGRDGRNPHGPGPMDLGERDRILSATPILQRGVKASRVVSA